jgi:lipopolysaccharide export system permease protein
MFIMTRYIIGELSKVFVVVLLAITSFLSLAGGVVEAVRKGLPPGLLVSVLPYVVAEMLPLAIPASCLFASCAVFGRMSADNELSALKALGIHPLSVLWPAGIPFLVLSFGTFWIFDLCAAWGRPEMERTVVESVTDIAYGMLRTERAFRHDKLSIVVKGVEGRQLLRPTVVLEPRSGRPRTVMRAEEAELRWDPVDKVLRVICHNGTLEVEGRATLRFPDTMEQAVPFQYQPPDEAFLSPARLRMSAIPREIARERALVAALEDRPVAAEGQGSRPDEAAKLKRHKLRMFRLMAEGHRRLSNGLTCFCFALVGAAAAARWRVRETASIFFLCFLPILTVFYPLLMLGEYLAITGKLPPYAVWSADAVLLAVGIAILRKVLRY